MMSLAQIQKRLESLPQWSLDGATAISKEFTFPQFSDAIEFVTKVAAVAERHGHHPTILIDYNRVQLTLTTHDVNGVTEKDFAVAEEIGTLS